MSGYKKTVDEKTLSLTIERRFQAPGKTVWAYFTRSDLLEQWWGPENYPVTIKTFDCRPGGVWHYYMKAPDGTRHWALVEFRAVDEGVSLEYDDYFSDENGNKNTALPASHWQIGFAGDNGETRVTFTLTFGSLDDLRKMMEMGFEEGMISQFRNLDRCLAGKS